MTTQTSPLAVIERLRDAMNRHDLDAFQACFSEDFRSEQPFHPDRAFVGNAQVRKNWTRMFEGIPDFQGDLLRTAADGNTTWSEWDWHGTRTDGTPFRVLAAILFHVENDVIVWGRLYMEPVEASGAGINTQLQNWTGVPQRDS